MSATTNYNPIGWANQDWGNMSKQEFKRNELAYELADEDAEVKRSRYSKPLPPKTVKLTDALAVAYAAYRINKKTYIKDLRRFEEASTQFPNKDLVKFYWQKKLNTSDAQWLPSDFEMFEPTEADYAIVQEALKWIKRYMMLGLGDLNDFTRDMVNELSKDEVPFKGMGRIAFAPEFIKRDRHESELKKEIRVEYRDSKHLGAEKDSVEAVIAILDRRYSAQWESYNYTAVTTEGNLVSFMNKFPYDVGAMLRCKAKVKAQTKNKLFSADETRLNYVKLYKV